MHIYGSYRKIKTEVPFFWNTRYISSWESDAITGVIHVMDVNKD